MDVVVTDEILNFVATAIDVAIRVGVRIDSQLMAQRLANHMCVVCASPDHVRLYGMPSSPNDHRAHPAIRFAIAGDNSWFLAAPFAADEQEETVEVKLGGRMRANNMESLLDLAIAGCGAALLPLWAIGKSLRAGLPVQLLADWEPQPTLTRPPYGHLPTKASDVLQSAGVSGL
ncbi:LysR substrate-binding domain-containing protein [Paraburkholderia oxyphila]|uniref:LysR substrate-binding domain-containing protein n=1 Tax=Paraburkholderia oxyphila TaxID=614212 RepID=UPI000694C61C|nr:LysR substrate-binding domain-containing protein [Paraburkholderia oxyphila]